MRDDGRAVFVISADLDEILSLSDRILVMYRGRIVGEFVRHADADVGGIGRLMGGHDGATARRRPHERRAVPSRGTLASSRLRVAAVGSVRCSRSRSRSWSAACWCAALGQNPFEVYARS